MSEIRAGRFWADEERHDTQGRAWAETDPLRVGLSLSCTLRDHLIAMSSVLMHGIRFPHRMPSTNPRRGQERVKCGLL
ncbi:hypothetical protein AUP68_02569 [Ilyonectria robusta]